MAEPDRYAVIGNPIGHSQSPRIHTLFAQQTQQHLTYAVLLAEIDGFTQAVDQFRAEGGCGLNVTVPFKQDAWQYADVRSERAERAGAVNTLVLNADDGQIFGDNTDGVGLVRDLCINHDQTLVGKRLLLLGAGGAARGVIQPLLAQQPAQLAIANRTLSKAQDLAQAFTDLGEVVAYGYDSLNGQSFDIIINATAAGLSDAVPPLPDQILAVQGCCYDMVYSDQPTAFVRWGQAHDAALALDGFGMLVEQAAESFALWRGVRPETKGVIQQLRP